MFTAFRKNSKGLSQRLRQIFLPSLSVLLISSGLTALIWTVLTPIQPKNYPPETKNDKHSLFSTNYPANSNFQRELVELKNKNELKPNDELEIQRSLLATTDYLDIPPSVLWCLLFQESRLNHLEGIESEKSSSGLGQFSRFSFFEINYQLERYSPNNLNLLYLTFGRDIRPIEAKRKDPLSPSCYYSIPTAVTSSAIFLNNRYYQLSRILDKRSIAYNPEILWMFAAMAYNKGSRSVLSLWNTIHRKRGTEKFNQFLNDYEYFKNTINDSSILTKSLIKIWDKTKAIPYANELRIHTRNISSCAISPLLQTTRSLTEVGP